MPVIEAATTSWLREATLCLRGQACSLLSLVFSRYGRFSARLLIDTSKVSLESRNRAGKKNKQKEAILRRLGVLQRGQSQVLALVHRKRTRDHEVEDLPRSYSEDIEKFRRCALFNSPFDMTWAFGAHAVL